MHLVIAFEGHDAREVPVTDLHAITVTDGVSGDVTEKVALEGVRALFLVRTDGTPVKTGADAFTTDTVTPEEIAATLGWVSPEDAQALADRVGLLETEVKQRDNTIRELEAHQQRVEADSTARSGLRGRKG